MKLLLNLRIFKQLPVILYEKTNIGFAFWFLAGALITIIFYKPFEQPILTDQAYFVYMSQVIFRGDSLYTTTTLGYTPFSIILIGLIMKVGELFSLNTLESAGIAGLLLYGWICGSFFILLKSVFYDKWAPFFGVILFCGIGYLQIISGVNADPKLWVIAFTILGFHYYIKNNWLLVGLFFAAAAMCWQVAAVSLIACAVVLPWNSKELRSSLIKFLLGVFLATLPVIIYLLYTNAWVDFWNQAVLRKLIVEGEALADSPFKWLFKGLYPYLITEFLHFIFGLVGFIMIVWFLFLFKERLLLIFKSNKIVPLLLSYTLLWSIFNTLEFTAPNDLFALLPVILIFSTFMIILIRQKISSYFIRIILLTVFLTYNFFDAFVYNIPFTYREEKSLINNINEKYGNPFVIGFIEFYAVLEQPMPTKYMLFAPYEDHLIKKSISGCEGIKKQLSKQNFEYIIERNMNKRKASRFSMDVKKLFPFDKSKPYQRGICANDIIKNMTAAEEYGNFKIKDHSIPIPLGDYFSVEFYYSIYKIEQ